MLSENIPLDSKHAKTAPPSSDDYVNIRVNRAQIDQLRHLGALDEAQAEAGRKAGGMDVMVPARLVARFQEEHATRTAEIDSLARRLFTAGLTAPARLFLSAGRPLNFFGSQMLLLVQPASRLLFREQDPTGRFYRLLEDRENVDRLLRRLDELEADAGGKGHLKGKPGSAGRVSDKQES
jgi:hypothetical protein